MATHGILSIWLAEIGRRLHEGETRISLKEVEAWTGTRVEPRIDAYRLWATFETMSSTRGSVHASSQRTRR